MTFKIRLAQEKHIAQIAEITNQEAKYSAATVALKDEPVERWLESFRKYHDFAPWLVALAEHDDEKVLGFAKASPYNAREGFNWSVSLSIYIAQDHKGQRLGTALYTVLFKLLQQQGFKNVYARIALPNPGSQILHERFGLSQSGVLPNFAWKFEQWHNMGIYTGMIEKDSDISAPSPLKSVSAVWQNDLKEQHYISSIVKTNNQV